MFSPLFTATDKKVCKPAAEADGPLRPTLFVNLLNDKVHTRMGELKFSPEASVLFVTSPSASKSKPDALKQRLNLSTLFIGVSSLYKYALSLHSAINIFYSKW